DDLHGEWKADAMLKTLLDRLLNESLWLVILEGRFVSLRPRSRRNYSSGEIHRIPEHRRHPHTVGYLGGQSVRNGRRDRSGAEDDVDPLLLHFLHES
ncbi:hypothetical protein PMAYCL1PPCAC_28079, partial [Pristionchus mayeri]